MITRPPPPLAGPDGYEDIARDPLTGDDHLLVEAAEHADGEWMAKVERVDAGFTGSRRPGCRSGYPTPARAWRD